MSGKQARRRRQQAAAPPPVARKGERRRASPKVLAIAGVAGLVIAGVVVGIALAVGGNSSTASSTVPAIGSLNNALPVADVVQREFKGIPQHGLVLGSPKAPVTMVTYIDLQCPGCRAFETEVMPSIVAEFVRSGKLKVEARPIHIIGPDSLPARNAAIAAARQNRAFNFMQVTYANQGTENTGWLNQDFIEKAAASVPGMDVRAVLDEQNSSAVKTQGQEFDSAGVTSTPTVLLGKSGSTLHPIRSSAVVFDEAKLAAAIRSAG
jgi:protein-disulfide isomerase